MAVCPSMLALSWTGDMSRVYPYSHPNVIATGTCEIQEETCKTMHEHIRASQVYLYWQEVWY